MQASMLVSLCIVYRPIINVFLLYVLLFLYRYCYDINEIKVNSLLLMQPGNLEYMKCITKQNVYVGLFNMNTVRYSYYPK